MSKLNPEHQFPHSPELVIQILAQYDLPLTRYQLANSGIENLTLIIWSGKNQYALRVYRQHKKSDDDILLELNFMSALRSNGIPIPHICQSKIGSQLVITECLGRKWQSLLMDFVPGEHPRHYEPKLIAEMATFQAKMHLVGQAFAKQHTGLNTQYQLKESFSPQLLLGDDINPVYSPLLRRAAAYIVNLDKSLPVGLIHGDFDAGNILVDDTSQICAILDFDDAQCWPVIVCLGYTLWDIMTSSNQPVEFVDQYLQVYQQIRPLSAAESAILPDIILFRHYVIAAIQIHLGKLSPTGLSETLEQERQLIAQEYMRKKFE